MALPEGGAATLAAQDASFRDGTLLPPVATMAVMLALTVRIYRKYRTLNIDQLYMMMDLRRKGEDA